jgi:long-chain acyl-CoA synthetase
VSSFSGLQPFAYLQRNAELNPVGVFCQSADNAIRNAAALLHAKKIAYEFRHLGITPGTVIALDLPEALGLIFSLAIFHEACIGCILPPGFAQNQTLPIDVVFTSTPGNDGATQPPNTRVIVVDLALLQRIEENPAGISTRPYSSAQSMTRLIFSSGTTGKPKPIALTYEMLEFRSTAAENTWMKGEPFFSLLGSSTVSGFFSFYASLRKGQPFLVAGTPSENVRLIKLAAVVSLKTSPAQIASLVAELESHPVTLRTLSSVYVAGSVLPPTLAAKLRSLADCRVFNVYGSSEAGTITARLTDSDDPFDAGMPTAGSLVQIVNEDNREVASGEAGRIRYQRPHMAAGYLDDVAASQASFLDGWFYPGDFGTVQPDGSLRLLGRESELINAGGVKIDPVQLDLFSVSQPRVHDACCFGFLDSDGLQQIGLALVADSQMDVAALVKLFRLNFGAATPKLVVRVESIPRNSMGKPLRTELATVYSQF